MLKCGCFEGLRKGSQRGLPPAPLDEALLRSSSPSASSRSATVPSVIAPRSPLEGTRVATEVIVATARRKISGTGAAVVDAVNRIRNSTGNSENGKRLSSGATRVPGSSAWRNGFRTKPEIETIRCSERSKAPFSLPQEILNYTPPQDQMIAVFANGDSERMIHCNTQLDPEECKELTELRDLAEHQGRAFSPSISVAATRCISDARGDIPKALEKMVSSQEWREKFFSAGPITDDMVADDLSHGVVYFGGRDFAMRPTVFVRPSRAPQHLRNEQGAKTLSRVLIFCLEYFLRYMVVPGKVENICVVVDLKDAGYMPVSALLEIAQVLSQQHAGRVWRFYICGMNWFMTALSRLVQTAMTDRQREKIRFIKDLTGLHEDFALHQLEEDLGGMRPVVTKFFPFPCCPGPFASGCSTSPEPSAAQGVHGLLTEEGARGRLWDPALSREDNMQLEYSASAGDIFKRCNLPVPQCLLHGSLRGSAADAARAAAREVGSELTQVAGWLVGSDLTKAAPILEENNPDNSYREYSEEDGKHRLAKANEISIESVESFEVCRPKVLSCMLCKCTMGVSKTEKRT